MFLWNIGLLQHYDPQRESFQNIIHATHNALNPGSRPKQLFSQLRGTERANKIAKDTTIPEKQLLGGVLVYLCKARNAIMNL